MLRVFGDYWLLSRDYWLLNYIQLNSIDRYSYRIVIDISISFNWNGLTIFLFLSILLSFFPKPNIHTFEEEEEEENKTINTKHIRRTAFDGLWLFAIQYVQNNIRLNWLDCFDGSNQLFQLSVSFVFRCGAVLRCVQFISQYLI